MLKKLLLLSVFVTGLFSLQVCAQGGQVNKLNYMMGTVSIPMSIKTNVLATPTATSCAPLLTSFHKYGDEGESVVKLQRFLNQYHGANLNEKGFYGPATMQEVKNLQYNYGIKTTGAQYEKTTELINALSCGKIVKKEREIYMSANVKYIAPVSPTVVVKNIYPDPPVEKSKTVVTQPTPAKIKSPVSTNTSSSSLSFTQNLKSDFDKIKENYKAYVLVFVLVLALFWFLRKAATE